MDSATLDRMAELAVGFGANVQPGQRVHVVASLGQEQLTRAVVERAYKAGAVHVHVVYRDPYLQRARLEYGVEDALGYEPEWVVEMVRQHGLHHGATIALSGPTEPGLLEGIDPARIGRDRPPGRKESVENLNAASNNWTIVPVPDPGLGEPRALRPRSGRGARAAVARDGAGLPPGHRRPGGGVERADRPAARGHAPRSTSAGSTPSTSRARAPT